MGREEIKANEAAFIKQIAGREPSKAPVSKDEQLVQEATSEPPQGAVMTPAVKPEPVKEKEMPREENKRRRGKAQPEPEDFKDLFLKEAMMKTRSGKVVYICKEHHDRISKILHVIGKNEVSLFSYLYNVLEHHFNTFQEDITEMYDNNYERIF